MCWAKYLKNICRQRLVSNGAPIGNAIRELNDHVTVIDDVRRPIASGQRCACLAEVLVSECFY